MAKGMLKPFTMQWWQTGIFKITLLSIGVVIGSIWPDVFGPQIVLLIILAIVGTLYLLFTWSKR